MTQQYLEHAKAILTSPRSNFKGGSKEAGIISLFGYQSVYDLREGFPLLTTKEMATNSMFHELLWFLKGDTNIRYLEENKCPVWRADVFNYNLEKMANAGIFPKGMNKYSPEWTAALKEYGEKVRDDKDFANQWGDAGPIYPQQWRRWKKFIPVNEEEGRYKIKEIDQIKAMIEGLKKKPTGKKHIISSWNVADLEEMSLPPCHVLFQATGNEKGELEMQLYQRSCDDFLGVPFNTAAYSALTQIIAQETGMIPKTFIHTFGDSHFYASIGKRTEWYGNNFEIIRDKIREAVRIEEKTGDKMEYLEIKDWINKNAPADGNEEKYDHVTAILEQLSRNPNPSPKLEIANKPFEELNIEDFSIKDYNSHPAIRRKMCV
jgi:thymidylate synthase